MAGCREVAFLRTQLVPNAPDFFNGVLVFHITVYFIINSRGVQSTGRVKPSAAQTPDSRLEIMAL